MERRRLIESGRSVLSMSELPVKKEGQNEEETVNLEGTFRGKYRVLAVFLIACAIFVAAFALTAIFHSASS